MITQDLVVFSLIQFLVSTNSVIIWKKKKTTFYCEILTKIVK
jgi:hypothetical protein